MIGIFTLSWDELIKVYLGVFGACLVTWAVVRLIWKAIGGRYFNA